MRQQVPKKAIYKVPNGKLLKILLEDDGEKIINVKITGDFFMHPEDNLEFLEKSLEGARLNQAILRELISNFLENHPTIFFGVDSDSLVLTILAAHESENT